MYPKHLIQHISHKDWIWIAFLVIPFLFISIRISKAVKTDKTPDYERPLQCYLNDIPLSMTLNFFLLFIVVILLYRKNKHHRIKNSVFYFIFFALIFIGLYGLALNKIENQYSITRHKTNQDENEFLSKSSWMIEFVNLCNTIIPLILSSYIGYLMSKLNEKSNCTCAKTC